MNIRSQSILLATALMSWAPLTAFASSREPTESSIPIQNASFGLSEERNDIVVSVKAAGDQGQHTVALDQAMASLFHQEDVDIFADSGLGFALDPNNPRNLRLRVVRNEDIESSLLSCLAKWLQSKNVFERNAALRTLGEDRSSDRDTSIDGFSREMALLIREDVTCEDASLDDIVDFPSGVYLDLVRFFSALNHGSPKDSNSGITRLFDQNLPGVEASLRASRRSLALKLLREWIDRRIEFGFAQDFSLDFGRLKDPGDGSSVPLRRSDLFRFVSENSRRASGVDACEVALPQDDRVTSLATLALNIWDECKVDLERPCNIDQAVSGVVWIKFDSSQGSFKLLVDPRG